MHLSPLPCNPLPVQIRHHGEFVRPIQALDPNVERYTIDREVVKECIKKVIKDININPAQYKVGRCSSRLSFSESNGFSSLQVLLSIPQNIPIALIGELLTLVLKEIGFQVSWCFVFALASLSVNVKKSMFSGGCHHSPTLPDSLCI